MIQAKRVVANSTDFLRIAIWLQNGNHAACFIIKTNHVMKSSFSIEDYEKIRIQNSQVLRRRRSR